jgi:TrwC relaxase
MSVRTGSQKWSGSAASYLAYALEEGTTGADASLRYHDRPQDGIVFDHVRGKAIAHLPGLDMSRGLTKEQHADLHAGRWDGTQYLKPGYAKQWTVNDDGEKVPLLDPETGKQLTLPTHTAGYDISFAVSKDISEYLIAHPQDIGIVRECLLGAVDKAMTIAVEEHARLVRAGKDA